MFRKASFTKFIRKPDTIFPLQWNASRAVKTNVDIEIARNVYFKQFQRSFQTSTNSAGWRSQTNSEDQRRKVIPRLVYLQNPFKYLATKYNLLKLRLLWDREFAEKDFIRGSKQAAVALTNIIRTQNTEKVGEYTTPLGFRQIMSDMLLSRYDPRLKLVKFDTEHLRRAIPMEVTTLSDVDKRTGRKYCFIDMLFVGLRNTRDFDTPEEVAEIKELVRQLDADMNTPLVAINTPHRIVFAKILIRFRRNYSENNETSSCLQDLENENANRDWAVSFYKILSFDVLSYDPLS